jgi:dolichol-phosphate mannosyltransferase
MDGDYSHHPNDLPRLLDASKHFDIVLGSRFVPGGRTLDSSSRKSVSRFYRWFARTVLNLGLEDPMSGFCVAHKAVYNTIKLKPIGYKVNLELIYKAKRKGFTVTEVPITFYPRRAGHSNAGMMEGLRTFSFILALRFGLS